MHDHSQDLIQIFILATVVLLYEKNFVSLNMYVHVKISIKATTLKAMPYGG